MATSVGITAVIKPLLYKNFKGWLHIVSEILRCMGSHLQ